MRREWIGILLYLCRLRQLRYRVDRAAADAVRDFCEENGITGIRINQDSKRWYPQGAFLASVLGFTNVDNAGVAGLELKYDDLLTGENGVVLTAVNAWGYTLEQSYENERFPTEGDGLRSEEHTSELQSR